MPARRSPFAAAVLACAAAGPFVCLAAGCGGEDDVVFIDPADVPDNPKVRPHELGPDTPAATGDAIGAAPAATP